MATTNKYLSLVGLQSYDEKIKALMNSGDAKSLKSFAKVGDTIYFFKTEVVPMKEDAPSEVDTAKAAGNIVLSTSEVTALKTLMGDTALTTTANTVTGAIEELQDELDTLSGSLAKVAKTGAAADVAVAGFKINPDDEAEVEYASVQAAIEDVAKDIAALDASVDAITNAESGILKQAQTYTDGITGAKDSLATVEKGTLVGAINELKSAVDANKTAGVVTMDEAVNTADGVLKTYTFYQGEKIERNKIGTINIPKDLVVTAGAVVKIDADAVASTEGVNVAGTYLKLTIANQDAPVYINVLDLVNDFTVASGAAQVQLAVSDTRELSASIVAGSITATELGTGVVETAKIADLAVATGKIADGAVGTAKIADSAVAEGKIAADAVTTAKIKNANVTEAKLDSALTTKIGKIATNETAIGILNANASTEGSVDYKIAQAIGGLDTYVAITEAEINALFTATP